MKVTLEEIAKMAGVSRGIVDRVYHSRGYVKAEKAAIVRQLLEQYDYKPNKLARALSVSQKKKRLAVILNSVGNAYFDDVILGVRSAATEFSSYGLAVDFMFLKGFETEDQLAAIDHCADSGHDALVLTPVNDPRIAERIDRLIAGGVPVVTVNTDIDGCSRSCYIGCDYRKSGVMAGGILALLADSCPVRVGIIQGSEHVKGHLERCDGFRAVAATQPNLAIVASATCNDDEELARQETAAMLATARPDFLYVVAGGLAGVMAAIHETGRPVKVIANDLTQAAAQGLQEGIIQVSIDQQPFTQGYLAVRTLFEFIYQDIAINEKSNTIRLSYITKYNL
jgi:LacI family transcriptional regulator